MHHHIFSFIHMYLMTRPHQVYKVKINLDVHQLPPPRLDSRGIAIKNIWRSGLRGFWLFFYESLGFYKETDSFGD